MKSKFVTTIVTAAVLLGSAGSFAFGSNSQGSPAAGIQDGFARNGAPSAAIVTTPTGDLVVQPGFHSRQTHADVSRDAARSRLPLPAVAQNPNGPAVVAQPSFQSEQTRAAVRQETARNRPLLSAIASNPQGDPVVVPAASQRSEASASIENGRRSQF